MSRLLPLALLLATASSVESAYPWGPSARESLEQRFSTPVGFHRVPLTGGFGAWLRGLPVRPVGTPVRSFNGTELRTGTDPRIAAVVDLDVGPHDLQQCADSIIRLHAEWLWSTRASDSLRYRLTSGDELPWTRFSSGEQPVIGAHVRWARGAKPDSSRAAFARYLDLVFTYAGTTSLARDTLAVPRAQARPGDFFVLPGHGGSGHAVLILDLVEDGRGHRRALIGQGFMPAQDFQVVAGPQGPWLSLDQDTVETPFWAPFPWSALHSWP